MNRGCYHLSKPKITPKKNKNFKMVNICIKGNGLFITNITMTKQTANKDFFQWFGNILGLVRLPGYAVETTWPMTFTKL